MVHSTRRRLALFPMLLLVFAVIIAACGDSDSDNTDADADTETETEETTDETEESETGGEWDGAITFGDFNWDSAMWHNRVAQYIVENGYGHETDVIPAATAPMLQGLKDGDVDVVTEMWIQNMPESYHDDVENGEYIDLGANYVGAVQGWFVPTYVIEGDE